MGMTNVLGGDRCVILSMHNQRSVAPTDRENRSAGSLHSRLLAGALLSMDDIPMTSTAPDFSEAVHIWRKQFGLEPGPKVRLRQ
jgi:hypothetical protein